MAIRALGGRLPVLLWRFSDRFLEAQIGWSLFCSLTQIQISQVIPVDHAQNGLLLNSMQVWVDQVSLEGSLLFIEPIGWNQLSGIVLRDSV